MEATLIFLQIKLDATKGYMRCIKLSLPHFFHHNTANQCCLPWGQISGGELLPTWAIPARRGSVRGALPWAPRHSSHGEGGAGFPVYELLELLLCALCLYFTLWCLIYTHCMFLHQNIKACTQERLTFLLASNRQFRRVYCFIIKIQFMNQKWSQMQIYTLHIFFFLIRICIFSSGEKAALKWERLGSVATHTRTHTPACQSPSELMLSTKLLPVAQPAPPRAAGPSWSQRWHGSALGTCFLLTGTGTTEEGKGK